MTTQDKANLERAEEINDLKAVLSTVQGRRVIRRILTEAGIFRATYAGENTHATAFGEGKRNLGLFIYAEIMEADVLQALEILKGNT